MTAKFSNSPTQSLTLPDAGLALPHTDEDEDLSRIIDGYVRRHKGLDRPKSISDAEGWFAPSLYQFEQLSMWRQMKTEMQSAALAQAADNTMQEAYFIEKSGLAYGARMLLMSETTETRQAYGILLADEASHLNWIAPFVTKERRTGPVDRFGETLGELVSTGSPMVLVFLLQVLLEGWGVDHYRRLATHAKNADVSQVCRSIFRDESLHHRLGEVMFDATQLTSLEHGTVRELTVGFLNMVRLGPIAALNALEQAAGGFNSAEAARVSDEFENTGETRRKLNLLRNLMALEGMGWLVEELEHLGLFEPISPIDMAKHRNAII